MSKFTASNGLVVTTTPGFYTHHISSEDETVNLGYPTVQALREYFATCGHEEHSKPWHNAQPGEVWDLETTQGTTLRVFAHEDPNAGGVDGVTPEGKYVEFDNPVFIGGDKIL